MDENSAYPRAYSSAWESSLDGAPLPLAQMAEQQPTPAPQPGQITQHQDKHQFECQHQRQHQDARGDVSPSPPTETWSSDPSAKTSPGRTIERLARKLSKHNLQQFDQAALAAPTLLPSPVDLLGHGEVSTSQSWAQSESKDQLQRHVPPLLPSHQHAAPWLPLWARDVHEPIEVDEEDLEKPDDKTLDTKPPRRQPSRQVRVTHPRLEEMIASGDQCNVRDPPQSISTSETSTPSLIASGQRTLIGDDPDCAMTVPDPAADDAEGGISLRSARGPSGIRKYSVEGTSLRYYLAADAALRCPNVVRNRPRMRRRQNKPRHHRSADPPTTSAVVSPDTSPSARSPPLPPLHSTPS
ncbi:hypothetical protein VTK26DRAFT_178 [Humicola hyalothermophila]